jgi:drug/metabolite transporter (DMT)-like permease
MLYFVAISRLPVGIGLLFEFTAPVFVALWVRFGEHQQVRRRLWVGLGLCVAGLISVTQFWAGQLSLDQVGILAGLVSPCCSPSTTCSDRKRSPLGIHCR